MGQFERLDQMLGTDDWGDAWGDHGVLLAADVLRAFEPGDWAELARQWADRPERWQGLAADVLVDGDERQAVPLLVDMIGRGADRARLTACDSLRVLLQRRTEPLAVAPAVKAVIDAQARAGAGLMAESLAQLQRLVRSTSAGANE